MAKILSPNKEYCGISAGVTFVNGVGETSNPLLLTWFREKGYILEDEPVKVEKPKQEPKPEQESKSELDQKPEPKQEPKPENETPVTVEDEPENADNNDNFTNKGSEFENMTVEELKAYAEANSIDVGRSSGRNGILKKILKAKAE